MFIISRSVIFYQLAVIMVFCSAGLTQADTGKFVISESGQIKAPIVVYKDAPSLTRIAADDLANYIEQVSGARPEVIEGWPDPVPAHAIWVGYQKGLEKLFPKADFDFKHPEEILITANENHLVIAGRDKWDPNHLDIDGSLIEHGNSRRGIILGVQQEYGTANAVYSFLHNQLGVRWLWPGEEAIPVQSTIALSPFEYRYHPQMRSRVQMFWHLSRGRTPSPGNAESNWYRFNHLQLDSLETYAGHHAFGDWWARFSKTHPEYFALQPDGTRSGFPGGRTAKICESNPKVWEQWLEDVEQIMKENPTQVSFTAAANDSWASGHCICENCRAWDDLNAPRRIFNWQGLAQEYVALSDRQVRFANTLARKLKERHPDRKLYVTILAYGLSRPAPTSAVPDDNVIIGSVANFLFNPYGVDRASNDETKDIDQFKAWAKVAPLMYWRPNVSNNVQTGVPLNTQFIGENFKLMGESGVIGIYVDTIYRHWALNGPAYYLMSRLVWNPQLERQAVLDDYFEQGFGPAASQLKKYQSLLDDARQQHLENGDGTDAASWAMVYTPEFFNKTESVLKEAADKVNGDANYSRRVAYLTAGLKFLKLQTQNRVLGDQIATQKSDNADALATMTANWQQIQDIAKTYPFAIHPQYLTQIRKRPVQANPAAYQK